MQCCCCDFFIVDGVKERLNLKTKQNKIIFIHHTHQLLIRFGSNQLKFILTGIDLK